MHIEFRKSVVPDELADLMAFDRKVFPEADLFGEKEWLTYESYWMVLDGAKVGCCAFHPNRDFGEDIRNDGCNPRKKGWLYITTTGILPRFRDQGFGKLLKVWQIAYAKHHGFKCLVTNCRMKNAPIIGLNQSLGYKFVRVTPGYYSDPTDATVVMQLEF